MEKEWRGAQFLSSDEVPDLSGHLLLPPTATHAATKSQETLR